MTGSIERPGRSAVRPESPDLVGRARDLLVLDRFLEAPPGDPPGAHGSSGALVVRGDPGIGKTALLDVLEARSVARGARVLRATGIESEVDIGFAALSQLLGPVSALVDRLPQRERAVLGAALGRTDQDPSGVADVAGAVGALLDLAAEERPREDPVGCAVVCVLDDLQWIDRASADVLGAVARLITTRPCRMVVAVRTAVRTYFDTAGLPHLDLRPLDDASAAEVLRQSAPALGSAARQRVLAAAAGNPLALLELHTQSLDGSPGDGPTSVPLTMTERLQDLFGSRITSLPPQTRHLMLVAALDQAPHGLASPDPAETLRIVAPAQRAALVEVDRATGRVRFRHPLVRATVVSLSTHRERRQAHRALAAAWHTDDDRAAWHLAAATVVPDEHVAALLEQAAARAHRRGDPAGAVRGLIRSAQLSPAPPQRARRLARAAFQGADVEGDLRRASTLLGEAHRAHPESSETLQAAVATSYLLLNGSGDTRTAHQVLLGALEAAREQGAADPADRAGPADTAVRGEALQTLGEICVYAADPSLWATFDQALATTSLEELPVLDLWVRLVGDPARLGRAALPDLERALGALSEQTDPATVQRIATAGIFVDRVETVRAPLEALVARAREGEAIAGGIVACMLLALTDFNVGRWTTASRAVREGLRLAEVHGFSLLSWPLGYTEGLIAAATGERDQVTRIVDRMHGWSVPRGVGTVQHYADRITALEALGRGDADGAYRAIRRVCPPGVLPPHHGHALWVILDLVEAATLAGDGRAAREHVRAAQEAEVAGLSPRLALLVGGSEAMAAPTLDEDLYEQALGLPQAQHHPFELARLHLSYGQRLRRARAVRRSREHLGTAQELFRLLGAQPWARRAGHELLATTPAKVAGLVGGPGLTTQEVRVATLAADGLSNKQIAQQLLISPRTVGAHLEHVFTKLGVSSRAALHHALRDLPEGAP